MKNVYLILTEQSSRLAVQLDCKPAYNLQLSKVVDLWTKNWEKQNLYITIDEEIKEGDWSLSKLGEIIKFHGGYDYRYYQKIILTTDQDLIKDGVQSISDEFLEWFVKNPTCDFVKIVTDKILSKKEIYDAVEGDLVFNNHGNGGIIKYLSIDIRVTIEDKFGRYVETAITSDNGIETLDINNYKIYNKCYKIIIPKEECTEHYNTISLLERMKPLQKQWQIEMEKSLNKQETLEEAAEEWKDIIGYESLYQISNLGNVKSLSRSITKGNVTYTTKDKLLKQSIDSVGYPYVNLSNYIKRKTFRVHQLIAIHFLNHTPDNYKGFVVDHINNVKTDNRVINLQLTTNRKNLF